MVTPEAGATPSKVNPAQVENAIASLLKWISKQEEQKPSQLLPDDQFLYVIISLRQIPETERVSPYKISLPHPLYALGTHEVCLIVNDKDKERDAKAKVLEEGIGLSKVLGVTKLKSNFGTHEAKRKLCGSYDLFLADNRILSRLPKLLGKMFFKKKKNPVPVNLSRKHLKHQIEAACGSAFLYLGKGTCTAVKVARITQPKEEIIQNVLAVINGAANNVSRKWKGISSISLKSFESPSLPIYQSVPSFSMKIDGKKAVNTEEQHAQIAVDGDVEPPEALSAEASVKDEHVLSDERSAASFENAPREIKQKSAKKSRVKVSAKKSTVEEKRKRQPKLGKEKAFKKKKTAV